jgi:glyoxylase-like metal-dependent hydrolase (beta-lactamase superfamily II)
MFLKRLISDILSSNCYILGDSGEGAVIDPGVDYREVARILAEQKLTLKYIIMTHAHIDHILKIKELHKACGGTTVVHEEDAKLLGNPMKNASMLFGLERTFDSADLCVRDGDELKVGTVTLEMLHTPGHTPGSMCILAENYLFTGDTLFREGVGRTDLGAGDQDWLQQSLKRLMELDDGIQVYPGHGSATSIGYERSNNIYLWGE